jgi:hypothetical protein
MVPPHFGKHNFRSPPLRELSVVLHSPQPPEGKYIPPVRNFFDTVAIFAVTLGGSRLIASRAPNSFAYPIFAANSNATNSLPDSLGLLDAG